MAYSASRNLAIQVAERGQIYTSSDLSLWLPRESHVTDSLRAAAFFGSSQRMIVTGESGIVLYADEADDFHLGSLLDGPTTDWLECVAVSPSLLVAAGDNGAIYTSTNGVAWKRQNSGTTSWLRGAAFGAGAFVAVGESGVIYRSLDGTNWNKRSSPTTQDLNRVRFTLGRFTAVGEGGVTLSSTNAGLNWFHESSGATNSLQYVVASGLDRLIDGAYEVRLQQDGIWSNELAKTNGPPDWSYYTAIGLPNFFLIAGQSGLQSEGYQTNEATYFWLTPYDSVRSWLWDVKRLPGFYVTVGDYGTVLTSGQGVDWTLEVVPPAVANTTLLGVGGTTNLLIAVGSGGAMLHSPNILTNIVVTNGTEVSTQIVSTLGIKWHTVPSPTTNELQGVATLSNSFHVITGGKGSLFTSPDGTNWIPRASGTTNLLTSVTEWPGGLVACGHRGTLITSANGESWSMQPSGTTNWLFRVRYLNQTLIAVGQNGTILTSANGTDWSNRTSGTTAWLTDAEFIEDTWFVVGYSGTVLSSTNLIHWIARGTLTTKPLYAAATDARQLVVVGVEGAILRSQVVPNTNAVTVLEYDRVGTNSNSAWNVFLFGGSPDQRFTLDRNTNLLATQWVSGSQLEILDGSGTLYYAEQLTGTNIPAAEFYRATVVP